MKIGIRKVNYKKRAKNKIWKSTINTTPSAAKRKIKKQINPLYGTQVSGNLKPKKKIYNKAYNKTSLSLFDKIFKKK